MGNSERVIESIIETGFTHKIKIVGRKGDASLVQGESKRPSEIPTLHKLTPHPFIQLLSQINKRLHYLVI